MYIIRWKKHTHKFQGPATSEWQASKPDYWRTLVWVNQGNSCKLQALAFASTQCFSKLPGEKASKWRETGRVNEDFQSTKTINSQLIRTTIGIAIVRESTDSILPLSRVD